MKKIIRLALSLTLLAALLAGCGNTPASGTAEPESTAPESSEAAEPTAEPTPDPTEEPVEAEYIPGERTDTDYTSTVLGLHFTLGDNMVMATDDEINSMMQAGMDAMYEDEETGEMVMDYAKLTTVYEMVAADITTGSNVIVMCEKLPLSGIEMDQYIEALRSQMGRTTLDMDLGEPEDVDLGGVTFTGLTYSMNSNGAEISQTMLLKKVDDRMYAVTFSYQDAAAYEALKACFSPLSLT